MHWNGLAGGEGRGVLRASVAGALRCVSGEYFCLTVQFTYMPENITENSSQPGLDELIALKEAAKLSGLSHDHLRRLAGRGDLQAKKIGRDWVTTVRAVREYLAQDRRPGPKPEKDS